MLFARVQFAIQILAMEFEKIVEISERTLDVQSSRKLSELLLAQSSIDALNRAGFIYASPIQWEALPIGMMGFGTFVNDS